LIDNLNYRPDIGALEDGADEKLASGEESGESEEDQNLEEEEEEDDFEETSEIEEDIGKKP